jgi:hypothetical protein
MSRYHKQHSAVGYSHRAGSILRAKQIDMEVTAANLRNDPHVHGLTPGEARKLADVFDFAARVFREQSV